MSRDHNKILICGGTANYPGLVDEIHDKIDKYIGNSFKLKEVVTVPKPEAAVFRGLSILAADMHAAGHFKTNFLKKNDYFRKHKKINKHEHKTFDSSDSLDGSDSDDDFDDSY